MKTRMKYREKWYSILTGFSEIGNTRRLIGAKYSDVSLHPHGLHTTATLLRHVVDRAQGDLWLSHPQLLSRVDTLKNKHVRSVSLRLWCYHKVAPYWDNKYHDVSRT